MTGLLCWWISEEQLASFTWSGAKQKGPWSEKKDSW